MILHMDGRRSRGQDPLAGARKAVETASPGHIRIRLDNDEDADAVSMYLSRKGFDAGVDTDGITWIVEGIRPGAPAAGTEESARLPSGTLVILSRTGIGPQGDALAAILMEDYLKALVRPDCRPDALLFIHQGVCLPSQNPDLLPALKTLSRAGVRLFFCATSLDYFALDPGSVPGKAVTMDELANILNRMEKIIRF